MPFSLESLAALATIIGTIVSVLALLQSRACNLNLEARQAINHAIDLGRGGIWLELTEEQYQRLRPGGAKRR